jgi:hypothetical protein
MAPKLMEDESGVNILIEYVMNFAIMLILFTIVLLTYQSLMTQSNNATTEEQLKIVANDVAYKITLFDSIITSTETHGATGTAFNSLSQTFDTQTQISGQTYYINVHNNYVVVHTADTNIIPVKVNFKTVKTVDETTITSASLTHKISYTSGHIEVT